MRGEFFYTIVLAFASGIFIRSLFDFSIAFIVWILFLSFVLSLWWKKINLNQSAPGLLFVILTLISFSLGMFRLDTFLSSIPPSQFINQIGKVIETKGVVVREPESTGRSTRLIVDIENELVLVTTDGYSGIEYGDEISIKGKVSQPESFETELGRTFDYPHYLLVRGIQVNVSFAETKVINSQQANPVLYFLFKQKHIFLESIQKFIPEPEVALGAGLLLGVKQALGDELENAFRTTGIIHIVVLSGANIMIVVLFITYVLRLFLPVRPRVIFGVVAVILFALMVGLSATVVRASLMAVLVLLAEAFGRRYAILRALFFSGFMMLVINPMLLVFDIGFQLSFMATLGLVLVLPQIEQRMNRITNRFQIKDFFLATVSTQIAVLPILLYQIGQFSLVSVIVNMLVLPMVPAAMLMTFLTGAMALVYAPLASVIGMLAYLPLLYIIKIATWFAAWPLSAVVVPEFSFWWVVVSYFLIGLILYRLHKKFTETFEEVKISEDLSGWTVVEETEFMLTSAGNKKTGRTQSARPVQTSDEVPIFFR